MYAQFTKKKKTRNITREKSAWKIEMKNNKCPDIKHRTFEWTPFEFSKRERKERVSERESRRSASYPPSSPSPIQKFVIQRLARDGEIDWRGPGGWKTFLGGVFRMRTVTEHDLRVENRGTGEKLLVVGRSANMWLTRSSRRTSLSSTCVIVLLPSPFLPSTTEIIVPVHLSISRGLLSLVLSKVEAKLFPSL